MNTKQSTEKHGKKLTLPQKKNYQFNIDYEFNLFQEKLSRPRENLSFLYEFEFLFFLAEPDSNLFSHYIYPNEYLDFLSGLGIKVNVFEKKTNQNLVIENWWGELKNLDLERKWNSKITSFLLAKKHNLCPESSILVDNLEQVESHLRKYSYYDHWILKNPYGMGGFGQRKIDNVLLQNSFERAALEKIFKEVPHILEPRFDKKVDVGTIYKFADNKFYHYLTFSNSQNNFKGATLLQTKEYISQLDSYLSLLKDDINSTIEEIQIDSMLYRDKDNEMKWYPLLEFNYRKTMGVVYNRMNFWGKDKYNQELLWIIFDEGEIDLQKIIGDCVLLISPNFVIERHSGKNLLLSRRHYLILFNDTNELLHLLNKVIEKCILKRSKNLLQYVIDNLTCKNL